MARSSSGPTGVPPVSPVASQTRFTCTAAVALGRIAGAPAYISTPTVTCYSKGGDATTAVSAATLLSRRLPALQVTVATPTSPANQRFQFFTPVIGQMLGSPVISGQASGSSSNDIHPPSPTQGSQSMSQPSKPGTA